jgi:hypothetical protein
VLRAHGCALKVTLSLVIEGTQPRPVKRTCPDLVREEPSGLGAQQRREMKATPMTQTPTTELVPDHPSIHCLMELRYDGTVSVIAKSGCSDSEVHEMLSLLASGTGNLLPSDRDTEPTPGHPTTPEPEQ